jgi:serine/threonine protein kinase/Tol biopolymer transport system component
MSADSRQAEDGRKLRDILWDALQRSAGAERSAFVAEACGNDQELRRLLESLLAAYPTTANDLLGRGLLDTGENLLPEKPGTVIGHYKLLEVLGEGGFGTVYRAEQLEPVKRQVALKIIKLGMDTREVIARFEAERQALAMMDHPNIARVYDAGATEKGRPFFVMDLIEGESITDYCDRRNLPVSQRLDLFLQVCAAVQHAHARGIVHRDLKPSNVLVNEAEGKPLAKVIDFGVAKSMQGRLTDKTLFTRREVLLGTPVYMSPEQLDLGADTVDARSDVYSLGVLLYELIAGAAPYESDTLRQAAFAEVQRILREVEPPKPSTRLENLGPRATEIAQHRSVEPRNLQRLLRGDLDWVVMRALEKDPRRRYSAAVDLAEDLQRHLRQEPVLAGPPGIVYRTRKFARRHQASLAWAATIAVILMVWGFFSLRQARQAGEPEAQGLIQDIISVEDGTQLSPDETRLAYVDWTQQDADLWVRDLGTGEVRNLTESEKHAPGLYECCMEGCFVWSPDSQSIAYLWISDEENSLRIIPAQGGQIRTLKPGDPEVTFWPEDWSADGRELLCRRWDGTSNALVLVSVETSDVRELLAIDGARPNHLRLSPDSDFLTYAVADEHEAQVPKHNVYLLEIATGQTRQLTAWPGDESSPVWAPDGSVVLFSSDRLGNWDLWGLRLADGQLGAPPFPVRYGIGDHEKRRSDSGKLIIHRKLAPGEGYTIAAGTGSSPSPTTDDVEAVPTGIIYFATDYEFLTMNPDGSHKKMLPAKVRGEPSWALHHGHRWFLTTRQVSGEPYPSGQKRRELFLVRGDGDESATVQLTDDPRREPLAPRWARDRETGAADGLVSWAAKRWDKNATEPPLAIFTVRITFNNSGDVTASGLGVPTLLVELPYRSAARPDGGGNDSVGRRSEPGHDWSPDGTQLVYCPGDTLMVLDLASGKTANLRAGQDPRWSPDGTRIVFCGPASSIQTIAVDGTDLKTIAGIPRFPEVALSPPGMMRAPVWSPDSRHILYACRKPGSSRDVNIYRIPAEGGEALNLTADIEGPDMWVAWRPGTLPKP